jgi:hypothetical protein
MAITYTWKITKLKIKDNVENKKGFVVEAYWEKSGVDADGIEGKVSSYTPFTLDEDSNNFVPFNELTEETVLSWVKNIVSGYEHSVDGDIERQINNKKNPVIEKETPWDYYSNLLSQHEYFMVIDGDIEDLSKVRGPMKWNSKEINKIIHEEFNIIDVEVPSDNIVYLENFMPLDNKPAEFGERVKIYKVKYSNAGLSGVFQNTGEILWVMENDTVVGTYVYYDKPVDEMKNIVRDNVQMKYDRDMEKIKLLQIDDQECTLYCNNYTLTTLVAKLNTLSENDTVAWRFENVWKKLTKIQLQSVVDFVSNELNELGDELYLKLQQIDTANSKEDLQNIYSEDLGA